MKKTVLKHSMLWVLYFSSEIFVYYNDWSARFWTIALVNDSITLVSFYICYYLGKQLFREMYTSHGVRKFTRLTEFWKIIGVLVLFIALRLYTDLWIFNPTSNMSIGIYSFILFRIALSVIIPGMLVGIGLCKGDIIRLLNKKQKEIESNIIKLETRIAHLDSTIETKEQVIQNMDEQMNKLISSTETLTLENERLNEDNEVLLLSKTALEEDISQHQHHILILKTELLGGQEDYKQLVKRYETKFDKLNRYRELYGEIDDDEQD